MHRVFSDTSLHRVAWLNCYRRSSITKVITSERHIIYSFSPKMKRKLKTPSDTRNSEKSLIWFVVTFFKISTVIWFIHKLLNELWTIKNMEGQSSAYKMLRIFMKWKKPLTLQLAIVVVWSKTQTQVTPCYKPIFRVAQSLCRQVQETSLFPRLALVAPAEMEVDRTHTEESSAGQQQALMWKHQTERWRGRPRRSWMDKAETEGKR